LGGWGREVGRSPKTGNRERNRKKRGKPEEATNVPAYNVFPLLRRKTFLSKNLESFHSGEETFSNLISIQDGGFGKGEGEIGELWGEFCGWREVVRQEPEHRLRK